VIDEVFKLWYAANIPTTQKPNAVAKLKALYEKPAGVFKNKSCRTAKMLGGREWPVISIKIDAWK